MLVALNWKIKFLLERPKWCLEWYVPQTCSLSLISCNLCYKLHLQLLRELSSTKVSGFKPICTVDLLKILRHWIPQYILNENMLNFTSFRPFFSFSYLCFLIVVSIELSSDHIYIYIRLFHAAHDFASLYLTLPSISHLKNPKLLSASL